MWKSKLSIFSSEQVDARLVSVKNDPKVQKAAPAIKKSRQSFNSTEPWERLAA